MEGSLLEATFLRHRPSHLTRAEPPVPCSWCHLSATHPTSRQSLSPAPMWRAGTSVLLRAWRAQDGSSAPGRWHLPSLPISLRGHVSRGSEVPILPPSHRDVAD